MTVIHTNAWVSMDAIIGACVAVMAGAAISTHATVGRGTIIDATATADDDVTHLRVGCR